MTAIGDAEMTHCACSSEDARHCVELRYGYSFEPRDDPCNCICHDADPVDPDDADDEP